MKVSLDDFISEHKYTIIVAGVLVFVAIGLAIIAIIERWMS